MHYVRNSRVPPPLHFNKDVRLKFSNIDVVPWWSTYWCQHMHAYSSANKIKLQINICSIQLKKAAADQHTTHHKTRVYYIKVLPRLVLVSAVHSMMMYDIRVLHC